MKKHSDFLNKKKDSVIENGTLSIELFDFYMDIFRAQEDFIEKAGDVSEYSKFFSKDSFPVLSMDSFVFGKADREKLEELMRRLTDIIQKVNSGMDFSLFVKKFSADADELLKALLNQDYPLLEAKGVESRLALDEFLFLIHNIFKPFMVMLNNSSEAKPSREDWLENNCPFCGYLPDMSKIVESKENQRSLHCSLCENEWEFPRLVCPACECKEQAKNGLFEFEDNSMYRVYYCEECRHYIKSVRIPKLKEESGYDLAVEDITTNFLDAAMIEKGYKRI